MVKPTRLSPPNLSSNSEKDYAAGTQDEGVQRHVIRPSVNGEADLFPQSKEQKKTSYGKSANQELSQSNDVLIVDHPRRARVEEINGHQSRP